MLKEIKYRRSIREYNDENIDDEKIKLILEAGMLAPSAINARDYAFIVISDKDMMQRMAIINGKSAWPLNNAKKAILVCGDLSKSYQKAKDYWIINASSAIQNMLIEAYHLGIGTCWIGVYPQMHKVKGHQELFNLPENIIPHSIITFGYPKDPNELELGSRGYYDADLVHNEKW